MYKLLSWYNQNRKRICWTIIAVIIIACLVYYILVDITENNLNSSSVSNTDDTYENLTENLNSVTLTTEDSALTGDTAYTSSDKLGVIDNFIEYCNNQDLESAYDLISDECKDEMYQDLEKFESSYYDSVFGGERKSVNMENWINDTYMVDFSDDFLSTGTYNTETVTRDYITIVENDDGEYKLNINSYIGRSYSTNMGEYDGLTISVEEINTYMNYEIYTFGVANASGKKVILADLDVKYTTYLLDKNDVKYSAYLHELSSAQLEFNIGQTSDIEIKYYNKYSSSKEIEYVFFDNIIFEEDGEDSENTSIKIEL